MLYLQAQDSSTAAPIVADEGFLSANADGPPEEPSTSRTLSPFVQNMLEKLSKKNSAASSSATRSRSTKIRPDSPCSEDSEAHDSDLAFIDDRDVFDIVNSNADMLNAMEDNTESDNE